MNSWANLSNVTANMVLFFFRRSIKNNIKYDVIGNNKPINWVHCIECPSLFLIGEEDDLID